MFSFDHQGSERDAGQGRGEGVRASVRLQVCRAEAFLDWGDSGLLFSRGSSDQQREGDREGVVGAARVEVVNEADR